MTNASRVYSSVRRARVQKALQSDPVMYPASLVLLFGIWEIVGRAFSLAYLPPVSQVALRLLYEFREGPLAENLLNSLTNLVIGFSLGASVGIVVGVLMGLYKPVEIALESYVYGFLTAPAIVFVPIYFTLFGLSRWSIVALIVQYTVFVVVINTMTAVKSVGTELHEMGRVFGATKWQEVRRIVVPAAIPLTFAGLRLGLARAIKGMINGEVLIALVGVGGQMTTFGNRFDSEGVLSILLLIVLISLLLLRLLRVVDNRLTSWLPDASR